MLEKCFPFLLGKKFYENEASCNRDSGVSHDSLTSQVASTIPCSSSRAEEYNDKDQGTKAVGTKSGKPKNEDFCNLYKGKFVSAIAIADGLGSSIDADKAAEIVVKTFLENVKSIDLKENKIESTDIIKFWKHAINKLKEYSEKNNDRYKDEPTVLNTTLLTIIELKDRYLISYLGNGSIFYIRGDFWHFWNRQWPWCISDLFVGHSFLGDNGKDILYGVMGPNEDTEGVRLLSIMKDTYCGEIFILTTDGISSPDHLKLGRDSNDKLWLEVNPHIESLVNIYFAEYFKSITEISNNDTILNEIIGKFLKERTFEDDATTGIIVSNITTEYYLNKNKGRKDENINKA